MGLLIVHRCLWWVGVLIGVVGVRGVERFSETRTAPVLLHRDREMLPPSHRTGYELYSPSFLELSILGNWASGFERSLSLTPWTTCTMVALAS
jgi:hypothetical protein